MVDPIIIVGGGLGGLTAALALQQQGFKVMVFEKARAIGDVGAGISLGTTASKSLYSLGLEDAINAVSDKPKMSVARHYRTGEVLEGAFLDRKWSAEDLRFTNQIHRADLYEILYSAVKALDPTTLRLGYEFVGVDQDADGVTVAFANGERYRGAALIGCDGIRSTVRSLVFGPGDPLFTGRAVYRFLVPMDKARPFMGDGMSGSYVAPGRSLLRYSIRRETLVNCVAFIKDDGWTGEGWSQQVPAEELESLFPGWHPDVLGLARNAPREGTAKWALYDRDPLDVWVEGRVALLGDSAHPMLPFLGLGAAMAIEDAIVLARALVQEPDVEEALQIYQGARASRAGAMLLASRRQGDIFADGPDSEKRPPISYKDRLNYDPMTVAL